MNFRNTSLVKNFILLNSPFKVVCCPLIKSCQLLPLTPLKDEFSNYLSSEKCFTSNPPFKSVWYPPVKIFHPPLFTPLMDECSNNLCCDQFYTFNSTLQGCVLSSTKMFSPTTFYSFKVWIFRKPLLWKISYFYFHPLRLWVLRESIDFTSPLLLL